MEPLPQILHSDKKHDYSNERVKPWRAASLIHRRLSKFGPLSNGPGISCGGAAPVLTGSDTFFLPAVN
jgi:hypothetical protein